MNTMPSKNLLTRGCTPRSAQHLHNNHHPESGAEDCDPLRADPAALILRRMVEYTSRTLFSAIASTAACRPSITKRHRAPRSRRSAGLSRRPKRTMYSPGKSTVLASMVLRSSGECVLASEVRLRAAWPNLGEITQRAMRLRPTYNAPSTTATRSTSPILSKPSLESSAGKSFSARKWTPSRSRIVFVYSVRFSRCAVIRPGSGFADASRRSNVRSM